MIPILGWYNQKNIGDDAFKDAFAWAAKRAAIDRPLHFFIETLPDDANSIVLGGGDVVRPYYLDKVPRHVKVVPIGVGLGYASEAQLLDPSRVPFALVRNRQDVLLLKEVGIDASYSPDLTFVFEPIAKPPKDDTGSKKVLAVLLTDEINPTFERRSAADYNYYEYFKWELARCLDFLVEFYDIVFVSFSSIWSIDDRKVALDIFRRMERRDGIQIDSPVVSVNSAREVIANSDLVLSMKFHGVMFAVQEGVPFISISESRKVELFCAENGLQEHMIPRFSLHKERFLDTVKFAESEIAHSNIISVSRSLREQARRLLPDALLRFSEIA